MPTKVGIRPGRERNLNDPRSRHTWKKDALVNMTDPGGDKYANAKEARQQNVDKVLESSSPKKIVVAGPGTGKTFLFKKILKGKKESLTLTFINSLVEDLSVDLCGLSEVRTLHGFALKVVATTVGGRVKVYPKLSKVIGEDARILKNREIKFDHLFHTRDDSNKDITFYKNRKAFYRYYGFADLVHTAVLHLEQYPDKIPRFEQVLVDEFQDFNPLEVSLIDLLASKSPILIAGDDDQSLYFFKDANPEYIRQRYSKKNPEYESFGLAHCSRCTRVIVDAVNDVISAATKQGFLKNRIDKSFIFFEDEGKEAECRRYPKLAHVRGSAAKARSFVGNTIRKLVEERQEKFSVLVIAPTKARCRDVARTLESKGFRNIHYPNEEKVDEPTLMDALRLLAGDADCNLGWRIAAKLYLPDQDFRALLKKTTGNRAKAVHELIAADLNKRVRSILSTFKKVAKGDAVGKDDWSALLRALDLDPQLVVGDELRATAAAGKARGNDPAVRNIPVKITTIPSSKGLAEDYVFIVDFDDRFFLEEGQRCSDQKVFNFLVALTRARRKVFLISSTKEEPKFLTWIAKERIEKTTL
jgi:ATP-dependent DNA helicase UvrD/PcrA